MAMTMLRCTVTTLLIIHLVNSYYHTTLQKAPILIDTCDESRELKEIHRNSHFDCAFECFRDINCRRMRVCLDSSVCTFYEDGGYCINSPTDTRDCSCFVKGKECTDGRNCSCPIGFYGDVCENIIKDCSDGYRRNMEDLGYKMATIKPLTLKAFPVICNFKGFGWTKIMNRENKCSDNNFHRSWNDYVEGFGNSQSMYWLGLEKIYQLLKNRPTNVLKVEVYYGTYTQYKIASAYYDNMVLGDASTSYVFHVDRVASWSNPTSGEALLAAPSINNRPFSTFDHDSTSYNCATRFGGGWWYADSSSCSAANITGTQLSWPSSHDNDPVFKIQLSLKFDT